MSTAVNKLRFMQKASEGDGSAHTPSKTSESAERWSFGNVDPSLVHKSGEDSLRLKAVTLVARRSYGGANPYIEQITATIERPRKKTKRSSQN